MTATLVFAGIGAVTTILSIGLAVVIRVPHEGTQ